MKTEKERKEKGGCRQRKRGRRKWDVDIEREEKGGCKQRKRKGEERGK